MSFKFSQVTSSTIADGDEGSSMYNSPFNVLPHISKVRGSITLFSYGIFDLKQHMLL
jgi:hypothetical protein